MQPSSSSVQSLNGNVPLIEEFLPALQRLDSRLEQAMQRAQALYGPDAAADLYRGLYVSGSEVQRLLHQEPGLPLFAGNHAGQSLPAGQRLAWLQQTYGLAQFDLDVLLLALAPELDRRYERIYAYLQDHVSRRWPAVDLALHLLAADAGERLQRRTHFDADAPLVRHGLIHLVVEQEQVVSSLLSQVIRIDEQVVRFLLHQDAPDARLAGFCRLATPVTHAHGPTQQADLDPALLQLAAQAWQEDHPLRLYFQGTPGVGRAQAALAVAAQVGAPLLAVDLGRLPPAPADCEQALHLVFRYARFYRTVLYLDGLDAWHGNERSASYRRLLEQIVAAPGIVILAGATPWQPVSGDPLGVIFVSFALPDFARRRACWQFHLAPLPGSLSADELNALAERFRLTPAQIAEAAALARQLARQAATQATATDATPTLAELFSAARIQSGHELAALARKIEPKYTWADIVLPADTLAQLHEICQRVTHRHRVLGAWGFAAKLSLGKGVNALFAGPSGAGKTMAAEIIANELGLDLYKIDLSAVVSKYIGETEKNLARIFTAAENANAILFFDEADALFGKRSEVSDAHDRYANIEISYLLQKMEEYDGVAILATNLRQNLDNAFLRRLAFAVHFPFPDEESRLQIWQGVWPAVLPLGEDVDLALLARQFKVAGGNIKNIALAAAYLAATDGAPVSMSHLLHAASREHEKIGRSFPVAA